MQHADDDYSRRGNFDGSFVHGMSVVVEVW